MYECAGAVFPLVCTLPSEELALDGFTGTPCERDLARAAAAFALLLLAQVRAYPTFVVPLANLLPAVIDVLPRVLRLALGGEDAAGLNSSVVAKARAFLSSDREEAVCLEVDARAAVDPAPVVSERVVALPEPVAPHSPLWWEASWLHVPTHGPVAKVFREATLAGQVPCAELDGMLERLAAAPRPPPAMSTAQSVCGTCCVLSEEVVRCMPCHGPSEASTLGQGGSPSLRLGRWLRRVPRGDALLIVHTGNHYILVVIVGPQSYTWDSLVEEEPYKEETAILNRWGIAPACRFRYGPRAGYPMQPGVNLCGLYALNGARCVLQRLAWDFDRSPGGQAQTKVSLLKPLVAVAPAILADIGADALLRRGGGGGGGSAAAGAGSV